MMKKIVLGCLIVSALLALSGCGGFMKEYEPKPILPSADEP